MLAARIPYASCKRAMILSSGRSGLSRIVNGYTLSLDLTRVYLNNRDAARVYPDDSVDPLFIKGAHSYIVRDRSELETRTDESPKARKGIVLFRFFVPSFFRVSARYSISKHIDICEKACYTLL